MINRRDFLKKSSQVAGSLSLFGFVGIPSSVYSREPLFMISLAEWSLHRSIFSNKIEHLDFAKIAKNSFGIDGIEYVNQFFSDKATQKDYIKEMKRRADEEGVRSLLIMCDGEGRLGDPNEKKRKKAVENHFKWIEAAKLLGCHSIRVNAASDGSYEEQLKLAADGLSRLTEFGDLHNINVIVENHGGLSSNAQWLSSVIKNVNQPRCGTLPDFGNFHISRDERYDYYKGVKEMMPFAKAVSAKSYDFDDSGNETTLDYKRMMHIVLSAGYRGYVGIEYEGNRLSESDGIKATKRLLERIRNELSGEFK